MLMSLRFVDVHVCDFLAKKRTLQPVVGTGRDEDNRQSRGNSDDVRSRGTHLTVVVGREMRRRAGRSWSQKVGSGGATWALIADWYKL